MTASDYITHEEIRARAHDLWERLGRPEGQADEHWLTAEKELQREREALTQEETMSGPRSSRAVAAPVR